MLAKKYHVTLTQAERDHLKEIIAKGKQAAAKIRRANLLLAADESEEGLKMTMNKSKRRIMSVCARSNGYGNVLWKRALK
jgi:hypothetical protein